MRVSDWLAALHKKVDALTNPEDIMEVEQLLDSLLSDSRDLSPELAFRRVSRNPAALQPDADPDDYLPEYPEDEEPDDSPGQAAIWLDKP